MLKKKKLGVNVTCHIKTSEGSYAIVSDNPSPDSGKQASSVTIFPSSKVVVYTGPGFIKEIEILQGLINVAVANDKRVLTPTAEFWGTAWVEVSEDGQTVVAHSRDTFYNRKTRQAVTLDVNQQVLITKDTIGKPEPMEQRFHQAQNILFDLGAFAGKEMYQLVTEKSDAQLEAYLTMMKSYCEQTGEDFEKFKKEAIESFQQQKKWAQEEAEKCSQEAEKISKANFSTASVIPINKTIKYQDIMLKILWVKRDSKNEETDLLTMQIEAKNESQKQIFIFWNEEARLINEKGEIFPVDDYNLETNFMAETQVKGFLFIPVNKESKVFMLQFGKKSMPKFEVKLDLT